MGHDIEFERRTVLKIAAGLTAGGIIMTKAAAVPVPAPTGKPGDFDFLECAPENWIGVGGALGARFDALAARHPIVLHGLSLSLGGSAPLDGDLLDGIAGFMARHGISRYSAELLAATAR